MFREMRRFKQQLSQEECLDVLKSQKRGVLSVIGDDGYPYGVPLSHWYDEEQGLICFHGAKAGHKIDAIRANDKVCYTVLDDGFHPEGAWHLRFRSVVAFGRIRIVEEEARAVEISSRLTRKFTEDEAYLQGELDRNLRNVLCLEIQVEHMTGKLVNER